MFCLLVIWTKSQLKRRRLIKRVHHAIRGEQQAESLLINAGFSILEKQKCSKLSMWVNGEEYIYDVRPDIFCEKKGAVYLVEVKTGIKATDPTSTATRRQLLEYFHGFAVDGVLLVNPENNEIHEISFSRTQKIKQSLVKMWIFAFILGAVFTWVISKLLYLL